MSTANAFDLNAFLATRTEAVNRALDRFLPSEKTKPATIHKAMRYSLFAGGKRMRPAVLLAAAQACGGSEKDALPLAFCFAQLAYRIAIVWAGGFILATAVRALLPEQGGFNLPTDRPTFLCPSAGSGSGPVCLRP